MGAAPLTARSLLAGAVLLGGSALHAQQLVPTLVRVDSMGVFRQLAAAGYEVTEVQRVGDVAYAVVIATDPQQNALGAAGFALRAGPAVVTAPPVQFRSYDAVAATLDTLAATGSILLDTIGQSWEGRPLLAAQVGRRGDAPDRPNVLFLGAHHAREWISAEVALRLLTYLATDPAAASTVADRDIWVIPVVNPDGYRYTFETERLWRKNRHPNPDGSVGVDLNRNYPSFWGVDDVGSSPAGDAETYRGSGPGSEPETQAVMAFHVRHPPLVAVSYHSFSDLVLYPYAHAEGALPPDVQLFSAAAGTPLAPTIVDRLPGAARDLYHPGPAWQLYPTNGDYTEWAYRTHGTLAYTVELTAGCCMAGGAYGFVFPDDSASVATVVADNLPFALEAIAAAGRGTTPSDSLEVVWPETRLVTAANAIPAIAVTDRGGVRSLTLEADSLDRGTGAWRWHAPLPTANAGLRLEMQPSGTRMEVVFADGAESASGWSGWERDSVGSLEGTWHWSGGTGVLQSPEISLAGIARPRLVLWVRHDGSLFMPERLATVDVSSDGEVSWASLVRIEGAASRWYPVGANLPPVPSVRIRLVTQDLPMRVDAVQVFGSVVSTAVATAAGALAVSENPVRSSRVYFTWQPGSGDARLSIFTFAGLLVYRATVSAADGQFAWDLTDRSGAAVANGALAAMLELDGQVLRRRLFVARTP